MYNATYTCNHHSRSQVSSATMQARSEYGVLQLSSTVYNHGHYRGLAKAGPNNKGDLLELKILHFIKVIYNYRNFGTGNSKRTKQRRYIQRFHLHVRVYSLHSGMLILFDVTTKKWYLRQFF